ncbi:putative ankyrin repeat-containing domain-containing protein [Rosa chinensis]|uniref:Putative ankyrin repeat-containing domain-containing protein n=1 Tax=Rosa chinensis TaxID=74649 RepID=A0A2P6QHT4_ROSCH|nr:putative ankyrin repeat-containing domain-containing protein [Rosa chinensis]
MQRGAFRDSLVGSTLLSIFPLLKGNKIVSLLLDNGADVNFRNYCGQVCRNPF